MPELTTFGATLDSLAAIRRLVDGWCRRAGASDDACHAVVLAVDEVCTNVIEHGYAGRDDGELGLRCGASDDEITIVIVDTGRVFDPASVPVPDLDSDWRERPIGGLGWHLVRSAVDEVRYESGADGNVVTLIKQIAAQQTTGAT
jgi:anti-sigma regulatory factor (Ser/Thr protein kinase)